MRSTLRLLASVQRSAQFLEPGAPTGLTGLLTHATPRSTLLSLYSRTLDKLKELPDHSVYRQSTEALTKHRLRIVESTKPSGLEEWQTRVAKLVDEHPDAFRRVPAAEGGGFNIVYKEPPPGEAYRSDADRVNAEYKGRQQHDGPREEQDVAHLGPALARDVIGEEMNALRIEAEPPLTLEQVGEMERQIGAGLIEEVIMVAQDELSLVDTMKENKVWEDLVEKPVDGQWTYNERKNM